MVTKHLAGEVFDGRLELPEEALALLPANTWLRVIVDAANGTVCIHAEPPPGQEITDAEAREAWHASWGALHSETDPDPLSPEEIVRMFKARRVERQREEDAAQARGDPSTPGSAP